MATNKEKTFLEGVHQITLVLLDETLKVTEKRYEGFPNAFVGLPHFIEEPPKTDSREDLSDIEEVGSPASSFDSGQAETPPADPSPSSPSDANNSEADQADKSSESSPYPSPSTQSKDDQSEAIERLKYMITCVEGLDFSAEVTELAKLFELYRRLIEALSLMILCLGCKIIKGKPKILIRIMEAITYYYESTDVNFGRLLTEATKYFDSTDRAEATEDTVEAKATPALIFLKGKLPHFIALLELVHRLRDNKKFLFSEIISKLSRDKKHTFKTGATNQLVSGAVGFLTGSPLAVVAGTLSELPWHVHAAQKQAKNIQQTTGNLTRTTSQDLTRTTSQDSTRTTSQDLPEIKEFKDYNVKCRLAALAYYVALFFNVNHPFIIFPRIKRKCLENIRLITASNFCLKGRNSREGHDTFDEEKTKQKQLSDIVQLKRLFRISGGGYIKRTIKRKQSKRYSKRIKTVYKKRKLKKTKRYKKTRKMKRTKKIRRTKI